MIKYSFNDEEEYVAVKEDEYDDLTITRPREKNIDEYWWRIYKSGDLEGYLRGTQFQTLLFPSTSALDLRAYCDSDWAGDVVSRKSTTGEVDYRAMAVTTSEIVWLRWLLADMGVRVSRSTSLHCDNRSATQIARNSVFHEHTKHIEIDCHFSSSSGWDYLSTCENPQFHVIFRQ
ncbi:uncharacterized mitochondrial protein-like protein [Tanacetum coccineum]